MKNIEKCIQNVVARENKLLKNDKEFKLMKTLRSRLYKAIKKQKCNKK